MKNIASEISALALLASLMIASKAFAASDSHYGEDAHHAESAGLPQFDPSSYPSQLFWLAIVFLVLYVIFSKNILPALSSTIESRHDHIQSDLESAEKMKEEAESVQSAYEEVLQDSSIKASEMLAASEQKIKEKTQKKLDALQDKAMKQIQDTEAAIGVAVQESMKEMDNIAAEVASKAAEKIVGVNVDEKKAKTIINNINKKAA